MCVRFGLLDEYNTKHRNIEGSLNLKIVASFCFMSALISKNGKYKNLIGECGDVV
jgi:hypothetical protein